MSIDITLVSVTVAKPLRIERLRVLKRVSDGHTNQFGIYRNGNYQLEPGFVVSLKHINWP